MKNNLYKTHASNAARLLACCLLALAPLSIARAEKAPDTREISRDFTFGVTVSPSVNRQITKAAITGIIKQPVVEEKENVVCWADGMHNTTGDKRDAGSGLSVGRNSIAIIEHGSSFRNTVLVWDHPVAKETRVVVVYKDNLPTLYVNGTLAAVAEKPSGRVVHPPKGIRKAFEGRAKNFILKTSALTAGEVAALPAK
jgi:hypothetical protein